MISICCMHSNRQLWLKLLPNSILQHLIFKKFPGGGMPPDPPRNWHASHVEFILFSILKKVHLFLKKNHPTKNPSYGPDIYLPTQNLLASTMYLDCAAKYMKLPEEIGKKFKLQHGLALHLTSNDKQIGD